MENFSVLMSWEARSWPITLAKMAVGKVERWEKMYLMGDISLSIISRKYQVLKKFN